MKNNNIKDMDKDIILTDEEVVKLQNLRILELKSESSSLESNENKLSFETGDINTDSVSSDTVSFSHMSSFAESFPNFNYGKKELVNYNRIPEVIRKVSELLDNKDEEIVKIFNEKGIANGICECLTDKNLRQKLNIDLSPASLEIENNSVTGESYESLVESNISTQAQINNSGNTVRDLKEEDIEISKRVESFNKAGVLVDKSLENSKVYLERWARNQDNLDLLVKTGSFVSPLLAYRALLTTYVKTADPTNFSALQAQELEKALLNRRNLVRKFNIVTIPLLAGFYLMTGKYFQLHQLSNLNTGDNPSLSISFLMFIKKSLQNKKNYVKIETNYFLLFVLMFLYITIYVLLPLLEVHCPSVYAYLVSLEAKFGYLTYIYPLFVWYIVLILKTALELYIYYLTEKHKELKELTKYLPHFIGKWVLDVSEEYNIRKELEREIGSENPVKTEIRYIVICLTILFILFVVFL